MTSALPGDVRTFPAPYIERTSGLIRHGHPVEHTVFYRHGDASYSFPPRDLFSAGDFFEAAVPWSTIKTESDLAAAIAKFRSLRSSDAALAGYISYEFGHAFEKRWRSLSKPDSGYAWRFVQVNCWYEADHQSKTGTIYATTNCSAERIEFLKTIIAEGKEQLEQNPAVPEPCSVTLEEISGYGELSFEEYNDRVQRVLDDIYSGRYYELNFTQRFRLSARCSPLIVYHDLFSRYAPRRGFYGGFGDESIGSCSPELFLNKQGRRICTRPIKGSITAATPKAEQEKLYAEHIMVVDLARNDIGRISDSGWVQVPELATLNKFGSLSHMESLVAGETNLSLPDILPHVYPAASITGAPKVEVVRAIEEYENSCRGLYTGTCGWIWPGGDFDLNVAIRTFHARAAGDSWDFTLAAGGAIVADSTPEREYEECLLKVQPLMSELLNNE